MSSSADVNNSLQDALNTVEQKYAAAMVFVEAIRKDQASIIDHAREADYWRGSKHQKWVDGGGHGFGHMETYYNHKDSTEEAKHRKYIFNLQEDEKHQADQLKRQLGPAFAAMDATLASLNECMNRVITETSGGLGAEDLSFMNDLINNTLDMMMHQIKSILFQQQMDSANSDNLSDAELTTLAQKGFQESAAGRADGNAIWSQITNALKQYHTDSTNAMVDQSSHSLIDLIFNGGGVQNNLDQAIIDNANLMGEVLDKALEALNPLIANVDPQFFQVVSTINRIIKQIKKILSDPNMSLQDKQKQVLGLVMFLLSFIQTLKQQVESEKVKNNQEMSDSAIEANKSNLHDAQAQQDIQANMAHNELVNKITQIVLEVVIGAIMAINAPGVGSAIVVCLLTAYEALNTAGVLNTNKDLANAMGGSQGAQIGADVVIGVAEAACSMGIGMAVDKLIEKSLANLAKLAAQTAMKAAEAGIVDQATQIATKVAKEAISTGGARVVEASTGQVRKLTFKEAFDAAYKRAYNTLETVAENTAQTTAKRATQQFMKQDMATLVELVGKQNLKKELEKAVETTTKDALEGALSETTLFARRAARGLGGSDLILKDIATDNANEAVGRLVNKSAKQVASESVDMGVGTAKKFAGLVVSGLMNNNFAVDMIKLNKDAKESDWYVELTTILQALLQLVGQFFGSGASSGVKIEGLMSKLPRYADLLAMGVQGVQSANSISQAYTLEQQANAVTAIEKLAAESEIFNHFLDMLKQEATDSRNNSINDQQEIATTNEMAGHMHDGDQSAINVILSSIA